MRKSDLLGKCYWKAKLGGMMSQTGSHPVWRNPDATAEELLAQVDTLYRPTVEYLMLEQYQKVGRKIELVEVKRYQIKEGQG